MGSDNIFLCKMDNLEEFKEWLKNNTPLLQGSINLYARVISRYFSLYPEISLASINKYISDNTRERSNYHVKFAFKYYLTFTENLDMYSKIVKVKHRPRKKQGVYTNEEMIKEVILHIEKDIYRDIATIQYATGARAREVLLIKEQFIDMNYKSDRIRIKIEGKGAKEGWIFLGKDFEPILKKYMKGKAGYLFLKDDLIDVSEKRIETVANNLRTYYWVELKKAADKINLERFGTHDFRRNFAENLKRGGADLFLIQKILRHSNISTTIGYFNEATQEVEEAMIHHQNAKLTH